jgi:hypothetical protein
MKQKKQKQMVARMQGKRELISTAGEKVNYSSRYGNRYEVSSKKLKAELLCDSSTPLLGIFPKE